MKLGVLQGLSITGPTVPPKSAVVLVHRMCAHCHMCHIYTRAFLSEVPPEPVLEGIPISRPSSSYLAHALWKTKHKSS